MGWNLNDLTLAAPGAPQVGGQAIGYLFDAQNTQHVVFTAGDLHIHELWWDINGWHHNDLTTATGSPISAGLPAAYIFAAQGTQHVFYWGENDGHLHELWWDINGWHHNDLTTATGAPAPADLPTAYFFLGQGTQHVNYLGGDSHINELWWDLNGWHHNDLTAATGAPLPGPRGGVNPAGTPTGYAFTAQGTQHVVYRGDDSHIYELWWDFHGWHYNDLTTAAGAPLAGQDGAGGGDPTGYIFDAQGTQHVFYVGSDQHIHELWWDINGWHHNDLTAATSAPLAYGHLTGYVFAAQSTQHVFYQDTGGLIHELWWDITGWHYNDISAATGAPKSQTPPGGYVFTAQGTQHVIYEGYNDGHIYELYWVA
jgi:hypothetical protein